MTLDDFLTRLHQDSVQHPYQLGARVATERVDHALFYPLRRADGCTPLEAVQGPSATERTQLDRSRALGLPDEVGFVIMAAQDGYDSDVRRAMLVAVGLLDLEDQYS